MTELTLYLRYKKDSKLIIINVSVDCKNVSIDEIAWLLADKMTLNYQRYMGGSKNKNDQRFLRRYKLGQYKFIKNYLEEKI